MVNPMLASSSGQGLSSNVEMVLRMCFALLIAANAWVMSIGITTWRGRLLPRIVAVFLTIIGLAMVVAVIVHPHFR